MVKKHEILKMLKVNYDARLHVGDYYAETRIANFS